MLDEVTVLILTYNEAPNIGRTLDKLRWARRIVMVDGFSTDRTVGIANSFPNVRIVQRRFDSFAQQCNFGLEHIRSSWVLSLDADYVLSDELVEEMAKLTETNEASGYRVRFRYCIHGRPLRASLYPPRTVLYRRDVAQYCDDGHGHHVVVRGKTRMLSGWIDHDDRKGLDRWLSEQNRYMIMEARKLLETPKENLNLPDRLRRWIVPAPPLAFFYTLLTKGLILDGWAGCYYVFQRTLAEVLLSLRLIEAKIRGPKFAD
ncbi:MAG: glycosyl transferase [Acidobacteria bacterium]|nr:MAG: glycosyl transferase [Acidobacteriota bacterium]